MNGSGEALSAYVGAEVVVGIRAEHVGDPAAGRLDRPRLRGRVRFVELLGAERLVQLELPATQGRRRGRPRRNETQGRSRNRALRRAREHRCG
jgi:hypothetical protein